jgi:sterol desaturase/sphingolipid hydroxylase (fatty acid hydroxylase superfamily)
MHTRPLLFIHREHHRSHVIGPWSAASFSLLEKFIFSLGILGGLALVSLLHPLSAFGILAYYVLYFYTNALGHANVEIRGAAYYRGIWGHLFNTPTYHALHHARYVKNYGLMTPWLDRLFGTAWFDVAAVQARVASGRPLTRLGEKCRVSDPA